METSEGLLRTYFERAFSEMKKTEQKDWLRQCAQIAAKTALMGPDNATWRARVTLGECAVANED
jgi:hypothetical protein